MIINVVKDNYLTLAELCEELSVSRATAKNWIRLNKLFPDKVSGGECLFLQSAIDELKRTIYSGEVSVLNTRRNKSFILGNSIYKSYLNDNSENIGVIQNLLKILDGIQLSDDNIKLLLAQCSIQLFFQREGKSLDNGCLLEKYLRGELSIGQLEPFIEPFISDNGFALEFVKSHRELFNFDYHYESGEDVLGLLYLSLKNIGSRKSHGAYYTPTSVVKRLIENLFVESENLTDKKIFDPCCGTGNFLLQLPKCLSLDNIYANDIDEISSQITKINLALYFGDYDYQKLCAHVFCSDFLELEPTVCYDYIIGNPPWGYKFSKKKQCYLKSCFDTAKGKNIESFDVVIEQSLRLLNRGGVLSFVVPESILNVKSHSAVREILIENTEFRYLEYLGNVFDGVLCPSIIMKLEYTKEKMSAEGLKVKDKDRSFIINQSREFTDKNLLFKSTDEEYNLVTKLMKSRDCITLKNNAVFALGIVTGNNSANVGSKKRAGNEPVLRGVDVEKYVINPPKNYIKSNLDGFQQVAPIEYYRAKEKLVYRFIDKQLVFAYDDNQRLSLNSCNILIPQIPGLNIKYVMAVLNSKISQFIYSKRFNSVKILRSHLEELPIPIVEPSVQDGVIKLVDELLLETESNARVKLYSEIEEKIFEIFELTKPERALIMRETKQN
ncbi:MAG: N-6 DNA methylase [Muribaculaceae bacterium]|nr:N-6 DNA methylase [Muribaculaceae bacterium]